MMSTLISFCPYELPLQTFLVNNYRHQLKEDNEKKNESDKMKTNKTKKKEEKMKT